MTPEATVSSEGDEEEEVECRRCQGAGTAINIVLGDIIDTTIVIISRWYRLSQNFQQITTLPSTDKVKIYIIGLSFTNRR